MCCSVDTTLILWGVMQPELPETGSWRHETIHCFTIPTNSLFFVILDYIGIQALK